MEDDETLVIDSAELEVLKQVSAGGVVAHCKCCRTTYTAESWVTLPYLGIQFGGRRGSAYELRNCPCGATLDVVAVPQLRDWDMLRKTVPVPPLVEA
jgi:hypothetical protein